MFLIWKGDVWQILQNPFENLGKHLKAIYRESLDRCVLRKHFKIFGNSKNVPNDSRYLHFLLTHTSLLHSPPPSLSIRDYTVGKMLHFHSTSLIGSKVTLCSFVFFLFLFFFLISDCLEMLVRVLGFRIVWLRGKYEKMKSVNPQMFLQELLPSLNSFRSIF